MGDGPYPSLKTLEQHAINNGSGALAVSFTDVFQNEVISLGVRAPGNRWEHLRNMVGTGTLCL